LHAIELDSYTDPDLKAIMAEKKKNFSSDERSWMVLNGFSKSLKVQHRGSKEKRNIPVRIRFKEFKYF
jgi:hypothetical protein